MARDDVPAAAYGCNPADGHHWVSQLSQEHIWVHTCSMCFQIRLDLDDHDAQVRADERERIVAELDGPARESEAMYAHACEQRDAARAEVAALRDQVSRMYQAEMFIDTDGYPSTRVFKAEVVGENEWAAHIRREVLADLRAKVEAIRDADRPYLGGYGSGWVDACDALLALIEEAGQ